MNLIEKQNFNFVFFDGSLHGLLVKKIKKKFPDIKIIIFFHDVCYDWIRSLTSSKKISSYNALVKPVTVNERIAARFSDARIFLSEKDELRCSNLYGKKKSTILPVAIIDKLRDCTSINGKYLLFVGANYKPNIEGIKWYINNVYKHSKLGLHVVGKNLEAYREFFEENNVKLINNASDDALEWEYLNACYVISPIFLGGGMKVKIAEAMMYGKIILGTSQSFIGYEKTVDTYVCNEIDDFVKYTKFLNKLFYEEDNYFSVHNREVFERYHCVSRNKEKFKDYINEVE